MHKVQRMGVHVCFAAQAEVRRLEADDKTRRILDQNALDLCVALLLLFQGLSPGPNDQLVQLWVAVTVRIPYRIAEIPQGQDVVRIGPARPIEDGEGHHHIHI